MIILAVKWNLHFWRSPRRVITSRARSQNTIAIDSVFLLLVGITISTNLSGESVLQRAIHGIFTYEASITACESCLGSVTIKSLGSLNFLVFWFVNVPGVHLLVDVEIALVYYAYLITALYPSGLAETAF